MEQDSLTKNGKPAEASSQTSVQTTNVVPPAGPGQVTGRLHGRHHHRPPRQRMFAPELVKPALLDSVRKLSPRDQLRNPVMFVVYVGSILTTILFFRALSSPSAAGGESAGFILAISVWLWFTVLFANFAEALAEGRSKQQAECCAD